VTPTFPVGKAVHGSVYVHRRAVEALPAPWPARVAEASARLPVGSVWNVAKLTPRAPARLSLLDYEPFADHAFPALRASHAVDLESGSCRSRSYKPDNPPILHRKELLLADDDPERERYAALTRALEARGLFEAMAGMGYARPWAARLAAAGFALDGHRLIDAPAPSAPVTGGEAADTPIVERHRTAITRDRLSAPMAALHRHGLIEAGATILDYGCGQGDDVRALRDAGIDAVGWDPHHAPDGPRRRSRIVNLGFVLNVIEEPDERRATLARAFALTEGCLAVAVMVIGKADISGLTPYRDGYVTRRRTFQKYFETDELRRLIRESLDVDPVAVAPGVVFVFKDELLEQRFLLARAHRRPAPAVALPTPARTIAKRGSPTDFAARHAGSIDALAAIALELARPPEAGDLDSELHARIAASGASLRRLNEHALRHLDAATLAEARARRRDDLRVYFALNAFSARRPYRSLPEELQRDVRAFFGSHRDAVAAGRELLFALADRERIAQDAAATAEADIGRLADGELFVHVDEIPRLSPLLRTWAGVAQRLSGSLDDAQIVKFHLHSGKLTALDYAGFDDHPLPRLRRRVKIDLRRQRVEAFDYAASGEIHLLYLKSRLLPADHADRERQAAFDHALLATGLFDFSGYGPSFEDFTRELKRHGIRIEGHRISRRREFLKAPHR
jgi:DNA phosphorothioation-associated putative methyltransferase